MPPVWTEFPSPDEGVRYFSVTGLHPTEPVHHVAIPNEALANRKHIYALSADEDALEHIMWEHHIRLNPEKPPQVIPERVRVNFIRVWGPEQKGPRGMAMTPEERLEQNRRLDNIERPAPAGPNRGGA